MDDDVSRNPIKGGFTTEHATWVLVVGALAFLILVSRGWRGVSVGGASVSVGGR